MKKKNKRKARKTKKLIFGIGITSIVLIVSTYAWFIGLSAVSVNEFSIDVKSSDGLTLSITGEAYTNTVSISKEAVTTDITATYPTNTNHWAGDDGLVPVSSVGDMDLAVSRLKLFSKTSILSLKGGYKLRSDLLDNHTMDGETLVSEQDGYVVFDLFIKNSSGSGYTEGYNQADDEGIYLSVDSEVKMVAAGVSSPGAAGNEGGDGIENSVRVAFMQIGRLSSSATAQQVQGIKCYNPPTPAEGEEPAPQSADTNGTSLCNAGTASGSGLRPGQGITWNIWEPNDASHNAASVSHFNGICKKRTGADTYSTDACVALEDGTPVTTYAVNTNILAADNVNIYDGLNDWDDEGEPGISDKITAMDYFTDTKKTAAEHTEIFYLAPNSITKIRVYIWLEGQDVDNYDLGSIGKKVSITFGFTKDKYSGAEEEEEEPAEEPGGGE